MRIPAVGLLAISALVAWVSIRAQPQTTGTVPAPTLVGWAMLPVDTLADGPTSGQFAGRGQFGRTLPIPDKQPVQGFSAVNVGPVPGTFYVMTDNGFGSKANSADALLRVYAVRPDFRSAAGGSANVSAADFRTGAPLGSFAPSSYITLHDPDRRLGFPTTADAATYPGTLAGIPVAPAVRTGRLLTGADIDPESFRRDAKGNLWFGDEFGPFLLKTDPAGKVLRAEIPLADVFSPDNPYLGTRPPNLGRSKGFEGMAANPARTLLYPLIEGTIVGDPPKVLRIQEFDVTREEYTGRSWRYRLSEAATAIGDMTAIDGTRFLVIERNESSGPAATTPAFKRVFMIELAAPSLEPVAKTEIVDLMNISDPDDLNRDGSPTFTFPFVTVENVLVIDSSTILIINDNNYPGGGGRGPASDNTELLLIRLPEKL
jgi:hypothetical protein